MNFAVPLFFLLLSQPLFGVGYDYWYCELSLTMEDRDIGLDLIPDGREPRKTEVNAERNRRVKTLLHLRSFTELAAGQLQALRKPHVSVFRPDIYFGELTPEYYATLGEHSIFDEDVARKWLFEDRFVTHSNVEKLARVLLAEFKLCDMRLGLFEVLSESVPAHQAMRETQAVHLKNAFEKLFPTWFLANPAYKKKKEKAWEMRKDKRIPEIYRAMLSDQLALIEFLEQRQAFLPWNRSGGLNHFRNGFTDFVIRMENLVPLKR